MDDDFEPTAQALIRCLQVLSEEAASLYLTRTFGALQEAIATCREESGATPAFADASLGAGLVH